jgi:CubicO group peptidase (beta-lactamase class C family)
MSEIHGTVAPGLEPLREAFADNIESGRDVGAACAVYVDGSEVVNLWGGVADPETGRPWTEDTMVFTWSTTKGVAAICALLLVQRGELDLERPVAHYWPEFAANGKEGVTVRMVLGHRVGLPCLDAPITYEDMLAVRPVVEALAAQKPVWEPDSRHGYHTLTFGWLVGEIVRRVTGRTIGRFLADEIAEPLGLDVYIGVPEDRHDRIARLLLPQEGEEDVDMSAMDPEVLAKMGELGETLMDPNSLSARAMFMSAHGWDQTTDLNDPRLWQSEWPSANGIMSARSLARLYAACVSEVDGFRLLSDDTVALATSEQSAGIDAVQMGGAFSLSRFGLGFQLPIQSVPKGTMNPWDTMLSPGSFGHEGAGGSVGFADPDSRVGFGYVMNKMGASPFSSDRRRRPLIDAIGKYVAR